MPLLDHFQPLLYPRHDPGSFAVFWASCIGDALHRILPRRYFAEIRRRSAHTVEEDVSERGLVTEPGDASTVPAVVLSYEPPDPTAVMPAVFTDHLEVQVRDTDDDARVVAAVDLVLAGNKDRPETRRAFAAKCAAYLQRGAGLITVDTVTAQPGNMHNELVRLLEWDERFRMPAEASLAAVAYRTARRGDANQIDVWTAPLTVGDALPVLPLALLGTWPVPLDLEATYTEARQRARL